MDICRDHEATVKQMKDMGASGADDVHVVRLQEVGEVRALEDSRTIKNN